MFHIAATVTRSEVAFRRCRFGPVFTVEALARRVAPGFVSGSGNNQTATRHPSAAPSSARAARNTASAASLAARVHRSAATGSPPTPSDRARQAAASARRRNSLSLRSPRHVRRLRNARRTQPLPRGPLDPRAPSAPPRRHPLAPPPRPTRALLGGCRHRRRSSAHPQVRRRRVMRPPRGRGAVIASTGEISGYHRVCTRCPSPAWVAHLTRAFMRISARSGRFQYPQRDSNPCCRRERPES